MIMRAFNEARVTDAIEQWKAQIKNEIAALKKDYILGVDETEYQEFLLDKYTLQPLEIEFESEDFGEPLKKKESMESELY
jgi:hypothetical protein